MIGSYPTVFAIGHKSIADIFSSPVLVEEKIDGSQFSFGIDRDSGELMCRSKGKQMFLDAPEKMFDKAVGTIKELKNKLHPGWVYRCEFLAKPKHNTLCYERIPDKFIILFDVMIGLEDYLSWEQKAEEAHRIEIEYVPRLYEGMVENYEVFNSFLDTNSVLGGTKIEGVVIKNYSLFTQEKKVAMGKYVSEKFKEVQSGEWRKNNPTATDIVDQLILKYRTPARWQKSVQHMKDDGSLEQSPRDIGKLLIEVGNDIEKECSDEIREILYRHFWPKIRRGVTAGLPEWYKDELAKSAFETEA